MEKGARRRSGAASLRMEKKQRPSPDSRRQDAAAADQKRHKISTGLPEGFPSDGSEDRRENDLCGVSSRRPPQPPSLSLWLALGRGVRVLGVRVPLAGLVRVVSPLCATPAARGARMPARARLLQPGGGFSLSRPAWSGAATAPKVSSSSARDRPFHPPHHRLTGSLALAQRKSLMHARLRGLLSRLQRKEKSFWFACCTFRAMLGTANHN